ncbi:MULTISPECIES: hypothetical protein [Serratia]|jgi:hypothetical protein|nr:MULTISPECIES: hypothetical protein [Serratia]MBN5203405.1 hypothetical protein [Serratia marcescens]
MPDNIELPKEGLYVSTIPGGERLVVVYVNVVEDRGIGYAHRQNDGENGS